VQYIVALKGGALNNQRALLIYLLYLSSVYSTSVAMTQVKMRGRMKRKLFALQHLFVFLTGPKGKSIFLKSTRGLQKACAFRQSAHSGAARHEPEIFSD
jgi:hypothetical protein